MYNRRYQLLLTTSCHDILKSNMMSRAYIYCSRLDSCPSELAEFELFYKYRLHSTKGTSHRTVDKKVGENYKEPQKRTRSMKTDFHRTNLARSNGNWKIVAMNSHQQADKQESSNISLTSSNSINSLSPENVLVEDTSHRYFRNSTKTPCDDRKKVKSQEPTREKKVTFVLDDSKSPISKRPGLTAQVRRQHFRNSYSKGIKNTTSDSPMDTGSFTVSKTPSITSEESVDTEVSSSAGHCAFLEPIKQTLPTTADRLKQHQTMKRKLKSCRSRSFHKSLDSSLAQPQFSCKKPLKAVHPEVVTMISLVYSEESEPTDTKAVNTPSLTERSALENNDVDFTRELQKPVSTKSDQPLTGLYDSSYF